jgi:hypothetical protein
MPASNRKAEAATIQRCKDTKVGTLKPHSETVTQIVDFGGERGTRTLDPAALAALVRSRPPPHRDQGFRWPLYSLIHSGLFHAASALRKMLNLEGRNFRFEYTAKTGICGEVHFGNSRISAPLASASSQ